MLSRITIQLPAYLLLFASIVLMVVACASDNDDSGAEPADEDNQGGSQTERDGNGNGNDDVEDGEARSSHRNNNDDNGIIVATEDDIRAQQPDPGQFVGKVLDEEITRDEILAAYRSPDGLRVNGLDDDIETDHRMYRVNVLVDDEGYILDVWYPAHQYERFRLHDDLASDEELNERFAGKTFETDVTSKDILEASNGAQVRVIYPGYGATSDYRPGRVTVWLGAENRIESVDVER